jgi:hypothetical protein
MADGQPNGRLRTDRILAIGYEVGLRQLYVGGRADLAHWGGAPWTVNLQT